MVDKKEIMRLLNRYFRTTGTITISDQGLVSCSGNIVLKETLKHKTLPVAFDRVDGRFDCEDNRLKTLAGAPKSVGKRFVCSNNQLTSLEHSPTSTSGDFDCSKNQLTTLEHAPKSVGDSFFCGSNLLTTLEHAPQSVRGSFFCWDNPLDTLKGLPAVPETLYLSYSPTLPLLRCLLAKKVQFLSLHEDSPVERILNKYAGQGKRAMFDCQKELEDAGFEENARW
jgi:hypothetical protein